MKHLHTWISIDKGTTDKVCAACEHLSAIDNLDGEHKICPVNQRRRDAFAAAFISSRGDARLNVALAWQLADAMMAADGVG